MPTVSPVESGRFSFIAATCGRSARGERRLTGAMREPRHADVKVICVGSLGWATFHERSQREVSSHEGKP